MENNVEEFLMKRPPIAGALAGYLLLTASMVFGAEQLPVPLPQAHAHNDYHHPRPLLDALDHGFCGVEADIFLVDGELLVGHDRTELKPERTLESLYLRYTDTGGSA